MVRDHNEAVLEIVRPLSVMSALDTVDTEDTVGRDIQFWALSTS